MNTITFELAVGIHKIVAEKIDSEGYFVTHYELMADRWVALGRGERWSKDLVLELV